LARNSTGIEGAANFPDRDCAVGVERTGSGSNLRKASDVRFELPRQKIHAAAVRSRFSLSLARQFIVRNAK
jgi:hypothetical protein